MEEEQVEEAPAVAEQEPEPVMPSPVPTLP